MKSQGVTIKEKDYEYYHKSRLLKSQITHINPLNILKNESFKFKKNERSDILNKLRSNMGKSENQQNQSRKSIQITNNNQVNPLARQSITNNPLMQKQSINNPLNPLQAKNSNIQVNNPLQNPLQRQSLIKQSSIINDQNQQSQQLAQQTKEQQQQKLTEKEQTIEEKSQQLKETLSQWEEIRKEFVNIFDIENQQLDQMIPSPFQHLINETPDNSFKSVQIGQNQFLESSDLHIKKTAQSMISKKNYLLWIEEFKRKILIKWDEQDKVQCLQTVIQSCKLLVENIQPKFFPLKFTYVLDIVELFGNLIFQRVKKLSFPNIQDEKKLNEIDDKSIQNKQIPENSKDIAINWIQKIGSIRELIPRILIEAASLKLYYFLDMNKCKKIFQRLTQQARCIGDQQCAAYFRVYLVRIGMEIFPSDKNFILDMFKDFMICLKDGRFWSQKSLTHDEYLDLFEPFFKTIFQTYKENCSQQDFKQILEIYENSSQHYQILKRITHNFPPQFISTNALQIFNFTNKFPSMIRNEIYQLFLPKIASELPSQAVCDKICELAWSDINQMTNFSIFLDLVASLIDLVYKSSLDGYRKNEFFAQMLEKFNDFFSKNEQQINLNQQPGQDQFIKLDEFMQKILKNCENISEMVSLEPFFHFIQYFPANLKPGVCKKVLSIFIEKETSQKITDIMSVHSLINIAKNLNPQEDGDSLSDEQKNALAQTIIGFIKKIDFGRDIEQTLNTYAEIRCNFSNISEIIEFLIIKTLDLTFKALHFSKKKYNKKTVNSIQACIAFCFITIPSINNQIKQLLLYQNTAQVSLIHNQESQTESIFKYQIQLLTELPTNMTEQEQENLVNNLIKSMINFLIVLPDNPQNDYLYLYRGFYEATKKINWNPKTGNLLKLTIQFSFLIYCCTQVQEKLPYHIKNVNSNDSLFTEKEFKETVITKIVELFEDIEEGLTQLEQDSNDVSLQGQILRFCASQVNTIFVYFTVSQKSGPVLQKLLQIIMKKIKYLQGESQGRTQLQSQLNLVQSTLRNISKNTQNNELMNLKEQIGQLINYNP